MHILGKDYTLVSLDFETYYGTGCSLSLQKLNTYTYLAHPDFTLHGVGVKVNAGPTRWVHPAEIEEYLTQLWDKSELPIALLCHNTYFDAFILHHFYDLHADLYLDTMCMSRGLFPNASASLKELAERLWPHDPSMRKGEELVNFRNVTTDALYANPAQLKEMIVYCEQDVELTYAAFLTMVEHYPDRELELIHLTLQMACEPLLQIDTPRVARAREQWIEEREATIAKAQVAASTLSSDAKFKALLESRGVEIKLKQDPKTEKWKPALGKADLGFQQMKAAHPELEAIFDGRIAAKSTGQISRAERFLQTAEVCGSWMPCPLIYYSAHTGRYGGAEKLNLQNLTRGSELRKSLIAPPDHLVYIADSSNIEARMLAWLAGQQELLDVFHAGGDVYAFFASKLYGFEVNKYDHPHERFVGKVCVLGLGYGMGWRKFQENMAAGMLGGDPVLLSDQEAQAIVQLYRTTNYAIPAYWEMGNAAIVDMYLGNERDWGPLKIVKNAILMPNGMALQYTGLRPTDEFGGNFEYWNGKFWTKLYGGKLTENITQALARIVLFDQMLDINNKVLLPADGRVVLNVHDEIIGVAPSGGAKIIGKDEKGKDIWAHASWAEALFARIIAEMQTAPGWCPDLPLEAEGGFALEYSK